MATKSKKSASKGGKSIPAKRTKAIAASTRTKRAKAGTTKVTRPKDAVRGKYAKKYAAGTNLTGIKADKGLSGGGAKKLVPNAKASDKVKEAPELEEQELSSGVDTEMDDEEINQQQEADDIMGDDDGLEDEDIDDME